MLPLNAWHVTRRVCPGSSRGVSVSVGVTVDKVKPCLPIGRSTPNRRHVPRAAIQHQRPYWFNVGPAGAAWPSVEHGIVPPTTRLPLDTLIPCRPDATTGIWAFQTGPGCSLPAGLRANRLSSYHSHKMFFTKKRGSANKEIPADNAHAIYYIYT